ncbi:hypothetical protein JAAARDRAFT_367303 [Jaapia argillacea MUCL 33604]|uniref:TatD DNase family Scn1 n=1 Tax=Jaapia argillacea MUCL 33604 TaxID=933084 RepID=A0A067Q7U0_9AGAM|nr:hypothetical protein JAAARDRAFT_367303 [Jaapia argillacea MUCL 33604]
MSDLPSNNSPRRAGSLPPLAVLQHVVDVHCHPAESEVSSASMDKLHIKICAMATRDIDQSKVAELATNYPDKVIPGFGRHPWWTHLISLKSPPPPKEEHYTSLFLLSSSAPDPTHVSALCRLLEGLPDPVPLQYILSNLRENLMEFPGAMLGEVGLDRSARVPFPASATSSYPRGLSPFTIPIEHQREILEQQLDLAIELKRNVSIHSVQAQQTTLEVFRKMKDKWNEKWDAISADLHSCGVSAETWKRIEKDHPNVFLSLSTGINCRSSAHIGLISTCSPNRILVESDIHRIDLCTERTWDMVKIVASVKGWRVEDSWDYDQGSEVQVEWGVVRRLEENWNLFPRGDHFSKKIARKKRSRKGKGSSVKPAYEQGMTESTEHLNNIVESVEESV